MHRLEHWSKESKAVTHSGIESMVASECQEKWKETWWPEESKPGSKETREAPGTVETRDTSGKKAAETRTTSGKKESRAAPGIKGTRETIGKKKKETREASGSKETSKMSGKKETRETPGTSSDCFACGCCSNENSSTGVVAVPGDLMRSGENRP